MPGDGATPAHAYLFGDVFAAYRLRRGIDRFVTAREAGIGFEGESGGDAAASTTGAGSAAATAPAPGTTTTVAMTAAPKPDADGMTTDAGREALRREREARKAAEDELTRIKTANATDDEKREASIRTAAEKARDEHWAPILRTIAVQGALRAKGLTDEKALNLYARAPEFETLELGDDPAAPFPGLSRVIDAFVADYPALFATEKPKAAPVTRGAQTANGADRPKSLGEALAQKLGAQA